MAYQIPCALLSTKFGNSYPTTWNKIKYLDILFREQKSNIKQNDNKEMLSVGELCMYMYVCTCTLHVPNVFEFLIGHIRDFNVQSEKQMEKGVRKTRTLF